MGFENKTETSLAILGFSDDLLEVMDCLNISSVEEIENRLSEIKKKADPDTYKIITQAIRTRNAVIKAVPAVPERIEPEITVMSARYTRLVKLVRSIKADAQIASESIYRICANLKEIKVNELYTEKEYTDFYGFCEHEIGIRKSQAKKYVAVAERLTEEEATRVACTGISNFYEIAMLDEAEREELLQTTDVSTVSNRNLKKAIKELETKHKQELAEQKAESEKEIRKLEAKVRELDEEYEESEDKVDELRDQLDDIQNENADLKQQIIALENRPRQVEYTQSVEELQRIEELEGQNELITNEYNELEAENKQLKADLQESRIREQEALAKAQEILDDSAEATEELERLREKNIMLENQFTDNDKIRYAAFEIHMRMLDQTLNYILALTTKSKYLPETSSFIHDVEHKVDNYMMLIKKNDMS